jgi:CRP/FNR family transcriptional regulator, cyclic AMP receptor protein
MTTLRTTKSSRNIVPPTIALPTRNLKPGQKLYEAGREANFLYLVKGGVLKAVLPSTIGSEQIADLYGPGDVTGFAALNGGQHAETVIALQTAYLIPFERRYALTDKKLSLYLTQNLAQQVQRSREALAVSELPVAARIAHLLLALSKRFGHGVTGSGDVELPLPLTQEEIASLIHSSRVTVTRVLGELRDEGAFKGSRGDYAMNPALLEAAADQYVLQAL